MGSSIPTRIISVFFWVDSDKSLRFPAGLVRKSSENSRREYCFHVPDISGVALQDPVTFAHVSCKLLRDPVAGTIDLGSELKDSMGYRE
jgi:hypothetical protein